VHAGVYGRLVSCDIESRLDVKKEGFRRLRVLWNVSNVSGIGNGRSQCAYRAENVEQVLEVRQRINELVQNAGKGFADGMIIDRGKMEVDGHLLILLRGVEQFVYDALLNVAKIL
jgi:hypothetical protein